ncbi:hypothetical protein [Crocinitomix algicola]|uniref:hypothetical protein n=1 Tax=Crocinitomix algicola TaxID=1740263 RepID=UPI000872F974|nr:hypothetical protein [Crocinitomix algicola]
MSYKVGVFSEPGLSNKAIVEAKKALEVIAHKYGCVFELSEIKQKSKETATKIQTGLKSRLNDKKKGQGGTHLSFGGEIEMD